VNDNYLKPVIAAVQHQQFIGLKLVCPKCTGKFSKEEDDLLYVERDEDFIE
jgi:hypothetical protein